MVDLGDCGAQQRPKKGSCLCGMIRSNPTQCARRRARSLTEKIAIQREQAGNFDPCDRIGFNERSSTHHR